MTRAHIYVIVANILLAVMSAFVWAAGAFFLAFHDAPGSTNTLEFVIDSWAVSLLPITNVATIILSQVLALRTDKRVALWVAIALPLVNMTPLFYYYGPMLAFGPQLVWTVLMGR